MTTKETVHVQEYKFETFSNVEAPKSSAKPFEFRDFSDGRRPTGKVNSTVIRKEREYAQKSSFDISPIVKQSRGLVEQEREDYEKRVHEETERRVAAHKEQSYQEGYNAGIEKGHADAFEGAMAQYAERVQELEGLIAEAVSYREELLKTQRQDMYKMLKSLTKWVLLREIKNDDYIKDLLERLILELHAKTDLIIKVNEASFERMPEVLEVVQQRVGTLTNVRLEIAKGVDLPGIILESQNGIIDGSIHAQFQSIDKVFESVGVVPESET